MRKFIKFCVVFGLGWYFGKAYYEVEQEKQNDISKGKKEESGDLKEDMADVVDDVKAKLKKAVEDFSKEEN